MASLYLITVPTLLDAATEAGHLLQEFGLMYYYGHRIMPSLSAGTGLLHAYISLNKARAQTPWRLSALASIIFLGPFAWTLIVMAPTNNELFRLGAQPKG